MDIPLEAGNQGLMMEDNPFDVIYDDDDLLMGNDDTLLMQDD